MSPPAASSSGLPPLERRSDASYLDFVEGFREYILGKGGDFEDRLNDELVAEGERRGRELRDPEQVRQHVQRIPLGRLRDRLARTQQEMKWHALWRSFDAQRAALEAELARWDSRGPGTVQVDPAFVVPPYLNVHFHLQPGGYYKDTLSGFLYHYGTKVFFRGGNDQDELHGALVRRVPAPADGRVARVLDLACSIGQSSTAYRRRFPDAEVWGIDYSAPMVRTAHRRAAMQGVDVNFRQALIEKTGFPDAHFDMTHAFIVFHELPLRIIEQTVREAARVTRPGGIFAVYDFAGSATMSPFQRYHRWFDARHNGEPYSQDFCDCDFDALLEREGFRVAGEKLGERKGGAGYMKHWFATRG
jgi:SAM-dependent methyltransferase